MRTRTDYFFTTDINFSREDELKFEMIESSKVSTDNNELICRRSVLADPFYKSR